MRGVGGFLREEKMCVDYVSMDVSIENFELFEFLD